MKLVDKVECIVLWGTVLLTIALFALCSERIDVKWVHAETSGGIEL